MGRPTTSKSKPQTYNTQKDRRIRRKSTTFHFRRQHLPGLFSSSFSDDNDMSTVTASRLENPEATVAAQSVALDPKATPNSDSVTQTPTVYDSSTTPQPPEKSSTDVGGETKAPEDCTSSDDAAVLLTEAQKKIRRSERFGVPVKLSEGEKRNSRAERFGSEIGVQGSDALKKSDEKKKAARAERFGILQSTSDDKESKKKAKLGKSAPILVVDSVEEDKRKARAVRFSQDQPASLSNVNGKGQSEVDQSSTGT